MLRQIASTVPRAASSRLASGFHGGVNVVRSAGRKTPLEDIELGKFPRRLPHLHATASSPSAQGMGRNIHTEAHAHVGEETGGGSVNTKREEKQQAGEEATDLPKRMLRGTVLTDRMNKSVVVRVPYQSLVPKYGKRVTQHSKIMAHDEKNECEVGDLVGIVSCRPLSKRKSHSVQKILQKIKKL